MAALVCDICGGKLTMGAGGIAICDSCGMEHTKERMQEKVQEIKGTVRVDNSHMIDNYYTMAENAYEAENKEEAENYCNKIIEIDPSNSKAWLLKGKAAGWQSTIARSRLNEAATCFAKAIDLVTEEQAEEVKKQATEEMKSLASALIRLRGERFSDYPDEEEANGFISDIVTILNAVSTLLVKSGAITSGFLEEIATLINQSVVSAWQNKILPEYQGDENRPDEYEWKRFIERIGYCTMLVEKAIDLSDEDDESDIQRYENLIFLHEQAIESCSWDYEFTDWGKSWHREYSLTNEAKRLRRDLIAKYKERIFEIKNKIKEEQEAKKIEEERKAKEEQERKVREYWEAHAEEKKKLEDEKENLLELIKEHNEEINNIPGREEQKNIQERIEKLKEEKSAISVFKLKERKAVQEKIDEISREFNNISTKIQSQKAKIDEKIELKKKRIDSINIELTKPR